MNSALIQVMIDEVEAAQKARFLASEENFMKFFTSSEEVYVDQVISILRHLKMFAEHMEAQQ